MNKPTKKGPSPAFLRALETSQKRAEGSDRVGGLTEIGHKKVDQVHREQLDKILKEYGPEALTRAEMRFLKGGGKYNKYSELGSPHHLMDPVSLSESAIKRLNAIVSRVNKKLRQNRREFELKFEDAWQDLGTDRISYRFRILSDDGYDGGAFLVPTALKDVEEALVHNYINR